MRASGLLLTVLLGCGPKKPPADAADPIARADPNAQLARQRLEDAAGSLDVSVRRFALVSLMALEDRPGGGSWAERGLWDPEPAVQRGVVAALESRLPEAETAARLRDFVARDNVDPYVQCSAASALARSGDASTLPQVQAAVAGAAAGWVAAPCALAAVQMGDDSALAVLTGALREGELPLNMDFFDDLGRSGLSDAAPALVEGLDLMEEAVELAAATALLELGAAEGGAMLRRALGDSDPVRQLEAVDFLMASDSERATQLLRRAGGGDVGVAASLALVARGEELPYPAVEALLSADREVRALACVALGQWLGLGKDAPRRAERIAHEALVRSLQDPEEQVRLEAIRSLGAVGQPADATALAALVQAEGTDWQALVASAALLKLVGAPPAR